MNLLTPGIDPRAPVQPAQTPTSQYLAAALKSLNAQPMTSPTQLGEGLLSSALLQSAQAGQPGSTASDPFASTKPLGGLLALGKQALGGMKGPC